MVPFPMASWLAVDPWEVTRKRIMDYMSVLEHAKEVCHETFPGHAGDITILYMCQASQVTLFFTFLYHLTSYFSKNICTYNCAA